MLVDPLPKYIRAEKVVEEIEVPGKDGVLYVDTNTYGKKQLVLNVYIKDNKYLHKIKKWLQGYGDLTVGTQPHFKYRAYISESISFDRFYRNSSNYFQVVVDVEPFLYPIKEYPIEATGMTLISNIGDIRTSPILRVFGNGDLSFAINGKSVSVDDVSGYIDIDCEIGAVFKDDISFENNTTGEFPLFLQVGDNVLTMNSNVTKIEVQPNTKYL